MADDEEVEESDFVVGPEGKDAKTRVGEIDQLAKALGLHAN
jgi:hypothetical protein